jgi:hypothetical protein
MSLLHIVHKSLGLMGELLTVGAAKISKNYAFDTSRDIWKRATVTSKRNLHLIFRLRGADRIEPQVIHLGTLIRVNEKSVPTSCRRYHDGFFDHNMIRFDLVLPFMSDCLVTFDFL